jgi:hypothetical protein
MDPGDVERTETALAIWQNARLAMGTPVETYLLSRGINLPPPPAIRFHEGLKHPSGHIWPAMVALVTNGVDGTPVAVHRTFLAPDGRGKAPAQPQKMMLGPCRGGAVRMGDLVGALMIGEAIETCLTAMQSNGFAAWAALSPSGLRSLQLPNDVVDIIVLVESDDAGEVTARECALRWTREGRRVRVTSAPAIRDGNS